MPKWNIVSWTSMLSICAANGHIDDAKAVFDTMPERNIISWNTMLGAFVQKQCLEYAKSFFDSMPEHDTVSWNIIVAAYAEKGHLEQKLAMDMPQRTLASSNALLCGYSQIGHMEEAWQAFHTVLERDVVTWTAMLAAYAQNGNLGLSRRIFDAMPARNVVTWSALIAGYAQNGQPRTTLELFHVSVLFISIMLSSSHAGKLDACRASLVAMTLDYDMRPESQHYSCMVDVLSRAGHLEDAKDLIVNMPYLPHAAYWRSLLGACSRSGDGNGAAAAKSVLDLECRDGAGYMLLANAYSTVH
ncbi:pentatricopeptide repeat-containing protein At4g02750-like [Selaginella moellendorffii]|uniref:pentatricopeptide repeat-containing protein At4g02750-like n=1 Tax=Selaginella moellendorffii TaxID=88036 RepID=UPI000D1C8730|nr:pentatricopeptide repeat-containing protein At4g02750-like [Selaginella moellendorffii]|eukprot:XP_024515204.1 pentatricopeptide repeat-containing protein At4g02750-like [Selaginella moellendorffii]